MEAQYLCNILLKAGKSRPKINKAILMLTQHNIDALKTATLASVSIN